MDSAKSVTATFNTSSSPRLLWKHSSGQASVWTLDASDALSSSMTHGPYTNWTPIQYSRAASGSAGRLLWQHTSGQVSIWTLDASDALSSSVAHGPYTDWTPLQYSRVGSCPGRLVWQHTSGQVSIWQLDAGDGYSGTAQAHGPYTNWAPIQYEQDSDCTARLVWQHTSGQVSIWQLDANDALTGSVAHGPYTNWSIVNYNRTGDGLGIAAGGGGEQAVMLGAPEVAIHKAGSGTGTITVVEQVCGGTCMVLFVPYDPAGSVMVQVEPDADSSFVRWEDSTGTPIDGIHYAQPGETVYAVFELK
jgi:hypothetical protein